MAVRTSRTRYPRFAAKLRAKLFASSGGETLVETLVSLLIVSAVVLMMCTAIVTAANINAKAKQVDVTFNEADAAAAAPSAGYQLKIDGVDAPRAQVYESNGYVYYKYSKGE